MGPRMRRGRRKCPSGGSFVASSTSSAFFGVTVPPSSRRPRLLQRVASAAAFWCCIAVPLSPVAVRCFSSPPVLSPPALQLPPPSTFVDGTSRGQPPRRGGGVGHHHRRPFSILPTLRGKAWDRLDIPEESTMKWYTLKCIAGTEMECLSQCRLIFRGNRNVDRFLVPTRKVAKTRGARRIVEDVPVYPGYVFARLRLCEDVYETVHGLLSVSSWVGTVRKKGYQKLPTIPSTLPPDEIEKIEKLEETMMLADVKTDDQLVDELLYDFKNLEVGGMVKVVNGIHQNEDGIVQRFKDGKVCVRMYTYGSQFDEWLDPNDVRPLTAWEVKEGITAGRPINQEQFNRDAGLPPPGRRGRERNAGDQQQGRSFSRRNLVNSSLGGNRRNRRQDWRRRSDDVEAFQVSDGQLEKEDRYWEEYQAKTRQQRERRSQQRQQQQQQRQRQQRQGRRGASGGGGNEYDVDSQWGRGSRRGRGGGAPAMPPVPSREEDALSGEEDWSAFVGGADAGGADDDDAFFDDLLSELSGALDDDGDDGGSTAVTAEGEVVRDIQRNLGGAAEKTAARASSSSSSAPVEDDDDFFARLEEELGGGRRRGSGGAQATATDLPPAPSSDDDFFATLEDELEQELTVTATHGVSAAEAHPSGEGEGTKGTGQRMEKVDLSGLTVPQLKDRLRERGLKVSGKKAELISRLEEEGRKQRRSSPAPATSSTTPAIPTESSRDLPGGPPLDGSIDHGETDATEPRPGAPASGRLDDAFFGDDEDDFFESLEREMAAADGTVDDSTAADAGSDDENLFIDELEGTVDFDVGDFDDTTESLTVPSEETTDVYAATTTTHGDDEADDAHFENTMEVDDAISTRQEQHVAKQVDLSSLTVPMLKERLRERGLKVSGKKSELIERLSMS